jgi:hypothetical protein
MGNVLERHPEPNSLRVIVLVSKLEDGPKPWHRHFVHWKVAIPVKPHSEDPSNAETPYTILDIINQFEQGSGAAVPAVVIARLSRLLLQVVEDYMDRLKNEGQIKTVVAFSGCTARDDTRGQTHTLAC